MNAEAHPPASPGRHGPWPALWQSRDVALVLLTLGTLVSIQWVMIITARAPQHYRGLDGLAFAIFPTLLTASGVLLRARFRGVSARELGFVRPRQVWPIVFAWVVAISAGPLTVASKRLLGFVSGDSSTTETIIPLAAPNGVVSALVFAMTVAMLVPVVEELIFRGLLHRTVRTRWPLIPSAILSGIVFAAVHLDASTLIPLFMVGFVFAWSYERSGSLWGSIIPHGGLNALTLLVTFTSRA
jgi:uncharacterized protein